MIDSRLPVDILLVEDNPNDAELTMRALRKNKIVNSIIHLTDGEAALDFLFARGQYAGRQLDPKPKLTILDLKLPKVDGHEVLKVMKSDPRTKALPVVVLTTSNEEGDLLKSYELGANSYIVKPVDFEKFIDVVRELGLYWLLLNEAP